MIFDVCPGRSVPRPNWHATCLRPGGRSSPTCYETNLGYFGGIEMKKLTSLLAVVALGAGIALVGCGSDDDTTNGGGGSGGAHAGAGGKAAGGHAGTGNEAGVTEEGGTGGVAEEGGTGGVPSEGGSGGD